MKIINIKEGDFYWYMAPFSLDWQIYKCKAIYFDHDQGRWIGKFEIMTDTTNGGSVGTIRMLNKAEMDVYIAPIENLEEAFEVFRNDQKMKA